MTLTPIRAMTAAALVLATMVGATQAARIGAGGNPFQDKDASGLLSGSGAARSLLANASIGSASPIATPVVAKLNVNTRSVEPQVRAVLLWP